MKLEHADPTALLAPVGEVFSREPLPRDVRNAFMEQSDTNALPPERLSPPPGVALPFPLPPTIPGAGPEARRVYRGTLPTFKLGDGSKLPDVPVDSFSAYQPKPEDVFDWVMQAGQRYYVYIREIDDVKEEKKEDLVAFHSAKGLKWNLALQEGPPNFPKEWKTLRVTIAAIGPEDQAKKLVSTVTKARNLNVTTISADQHERWFLRRTVENAFVEECRKNGSPNPADLSVDGLKLVAAEMGKLGDAGQGGREGLGEGDRGARAGARQVRAAPAAQRHRRPARPDRGLPRDPRPAPHARDPVALRRGAPRAGPDRPTGPRGSATSTSSG